MEKAYLCLQEFYGLGPEFPLQTHLVTRCLDAADRPRKCYYVSDAVRHLLMLDETESLKVIAIGLKVSSLPLTICDEVVFEYVAVAG